MKRTAALSIRVRPLVAAAPGVYVWQIMRGRNEVLSDIAATEPMARDRAEAARADIQAQAHRGQHA